MGKLPFFGEAYILILDLVIPEKKTKTNVLELVIRFENDKKCRLISILNTGRISCLRWQSFPKV